MVFFAILVSCHCSPRYYLLLLLLLFVLCRGGQDDDTKDESETKEAPMKSPRISSCSNFELFFVFLCVK